MYKLPDTLSKKDKSKLEGILYDLLPLYRPEWEYGASFPDGKRWTITDGTGSDWGIIDILDTEEEAKQVCEWANHQIRDWNGRFSNDL